MSRYRVTAPVAVALIEGSAVYLERGTIFGGAQNVDHLVAVGLVEAVADAPVVTEEPEAAAEEAAPAAEAKPAPRKR